MSTNKAAAEKVSAPTPAKILRPTKLHVLFTVPNLIGIIFSCQILMISGYVRVILAFAAFYYAYDTPVVAGFCYSISYLLDALDGVAARKLNQGTEFGAVLDMVTDRFCDACILLVLSNLYPEHRFLFTSLLILDFTSHWVQMYSTLKCGETHHKTAKSKFWLIKFYYSFPILLLVCLFAEVFLVGLYITHFSKTLITNALVQSVVYTLMMIASPVYIFKQIISVVQLISAVDKCLELDWVGRKTE